MTLLLAKDTVIQVSPLWGLILTALGIVIGALFSLRLVKRDYKKDIVDDLNEKKSIELRLKVVEENIKTQIRDHRELKEQITEQYARFLTTLEKQNNEVNSLIVKLIDKLA